MKRLVRCLIAGLFLIAEASSAQVANVWQEQATAPRLEALKKQLQSGKSAVLEKFWDEMKSRGTPLVEAIPGDPNHVLVAFVYRSLKPAKAVVLYCQLSATRDLSLNVMKRLLDTDLWFKVYRLPNNLRLSYSFVPDPSEESLGNRPDLQLPDSFNPKTVVAGANVGHSMLELPAAPVEHWISPQSGVPTGKLEQIKIDSTILKSQRTAWIYLPPGFDPKRPQPYPLLVCLDGLTYASQDSIPGPTILDNLIARKKLPPTLLLTIEQAPQPQRNIELSNNQQFLDFVSDELLPHIREKWHATSDPAQTTVCGSSAGGLASTYFGFRRPDVFGNVISQSGAYWPGEERNNPEHEWLTRQIAASPRLPVRFVLQPGILETGSTPLNGPSILAANRHLRDVLLAKGYEVHYTEMPGGHEPLTWRGGFSNALLELASKSDQTVNANKVGGHFPVPAVQGIVTAFQKHPVVIIGEARHGLRPMGDFLIHLVRDPHFQAVAQDIVIEFASRNNQPLLDRYVSGADVPAEEARHLWRDTTKVGAWEAPIYAEWLQAIRDVNRKLPPDRRFCVLAGDTAIDWSHIHTHDEWVALGDNNISFSEVIVNQVLKNKRHALVVLGGNHVAKVGARTGDPNTTTMVEARYPGSTYVVMHSLAAPDAVEQKLRLPDSKEAALYDLAGTPLSESPDPNGVAPIRYTDAWLYLGPKQSMVESEPSPGSLEADYGKEIDRRSMIEWRELRARKFLGPAIAK